MTTLQLSPSTQEGGVDMKFSYSKDVDILMVQLSDKPFDYAEETDGVISHFSKQGKLVLLEIQGARKFLGSALETVEKEGSYD